MFKRLILACFLVSLIGCSKQPEWSTYLWPKEENSYYRLCKKWTKAANFYLGLDESVQIVALYKSKEWQEGFVREWAKTYQLSSLEEKKFGEQIKEENKGYFSFVVAIAATQDKVKELKTPPSLWSLFLLQKGKKVYPVEIRPLEWPWPKVEKFYPFSQPWQNLYEVKFEQEEETFEEMVLAGPEGKAVFCW